MRFPKGDCVLVQMVWVHFKVFNMELLSIFKSIMLLCWLGCIIWQIGLIWKSKHFFIYPWLHEYMIYYNPFVIFSTNFLNVIWSLLNWPKSWKQKVTINNLLFPWFGSIWQTPNGILEVWIDFWSSKLWIGQLTGMIKNWKVHFKFSSELSIVI